MLLTASFFLFYQLFLLLLEKNMWTLEKIKPYINTDVVFEVYGKHYTLGGVLENSEGDILFFDKDNPIDVNNDKPSYFNSRILEVKLLLKPISNIGNEILINNVLVSPKQLILDELGYDYDFEWYVHNLTPTLPQEIYDKLTKLHFDVHFLLNENKAIYV